MTEQEMLEYIAQKQDQLLERQRQLIEANQKLFEAGKFAGQQQLQIDRLREALTMFCDHYLNLDEPYSLARAALKEEDMLDGQ